METKFHRGELVMFVDANNRVCIGRFMGLSDDGTRAVIETTNAHIPNATYTIQPTLDRVGEITQGFISKMMGVYRGELSENFEGI